MDTETTTPETTDIIVVAEVVEQDTDSFGKEIAKTLTVSAASSAGVIVGALAIGFASKKVSQLRAKRAAKKAGPEVVETDTTDTQQD
jgi:uncharacterized membrane protein YjjB (DUF3815 family)